MMDVDRIQQKLGAKYRFQVISFVCLGIIYARGAWNVFGVLFLAAAVGHTCDTDREIVTLHSRNKATSLQNVATNSSITTTAWTAETLSGRKVIGGRECDVIVAGENGTNISMPCTYGWVYSSDFESTIVSEWDLVCVRAYLTDLSTTIYMVGSMCGALFISPMSDKFGRRLILLLCLLAQAAVGACVALSPNYAVFTTLRFVVGFFNMGIALCTYVMMTELFPAQHRTIPCCGFQIFWAFGVMLTALFGFMVRDWRHLQLVFSLPNVLCAVFVWFLPESLPWLISQNKLNKAQSVIDRISKFNAIDPPNDIHVYDSLGMQGSNGEEPEGSASTAHQSQDQPLLSGTSTQGEAASLLSESSSHTESQHESEDAESNEALSQNGKPQNGSAKSFSPSQEVADASVDTEIQIINNVPTTCTVIRQEEQVRQGFGPHRLKSVLVLCQSSRIRLYTFILCYLFFVNSLSYFGISLSTPVLHGDQFINLFLLGVVEIPAYVIAVFVCERIGRKVPLCVFLLMCGVMNITAMLISEEASSGMSGVRVAFVMLGKFAITGAYTTVYLYSAEIFPTSVRNHAIGISSFFENFGSIAAPFLVFSAKSIPELPMVLFGIVSVIGGVMVTAMPETHRRPLPQTVEEVESWDMCKRRRRE